MMEQGFKGIVNESPDGAVCACCGRTYSIKQFHKRASHTEQKDGVMIVYWKCKKGTENITMYPIARTS